MSHIDVETTVVLTSSNNVSLQATNMSLTTVYQQQQSPLFYLPQELRNQIYNHYIYREDGCHYDFASSKL
jgi:hypothetical protein